MSSPYSILPKFSGFISDQLFYKKLINSNCLKDDDCKDMDENFDLNELEEVFSDHTFFRKRLERSLYGGSLDDVDEDIDHPPMALNGLALKLFTKAVPNYGLDQLDMDYVSSVSESTRVSPCAMILALIYLERLQIKNSDYLESVSPSGLFVVTMLVASKFLFENEDDIVTNQTWSEALNMDIKDLNMLEQKFLAAIDWQLYVDSSEFFQQLSSIEKMIAVKQSSIRGWLSYGDVCSILQDALIKKAILISIDKIIKVFAVSALSYAVTVISLYTAGCVINFRHNQNLTSYRESTQIKTNLPRSAQLSKFTSEESFYLESLPSNLNNVENNDFNDFSLIENTESISLSLKKSVVSCFNLFSLQKVESENNISSIDNAVHPKIFDVEWWPFGFNNACIPVSVR